MTNENIFYNSDEYDEYKDSYNEYKDKWLSDKFLKRLNIIKIKINELIDRHAKDKTNVKFYTPHDSSHFREVEKNIYRLLPNEIYKKLSEYERFYLLAGAWLHDVGMYREALLPSRGLSGENIRMNHHNYSEEIITEFYDELGIDEHEAIVLSILSRYHRKKENIYNCNEIISDRGTDIRIRLLSAYLRLADGLHIDQSRSPDKYYAIAKTFGLSQYQKMHWIRSKLVLGIGIDITNCTLTIHLKYPNNLEYVLPEDNAEEANEEFRKKIQKIYSNSIIDDLKLELESVKNILIENKITVFIHLKHIVHEVFFDRKFLNDIYTILNADILLKSPSSSVLYDSYLSTLENMFFDFKEQLNYTDKQNQGNFSYEFIKQVSEVNTEFFEAVNKKRRCHFQLIELMSHINKICIENKGKQKDVVKEQKICMKFICDILLRKIHIYEKINDQNHIIEIEKLKKHNKEMIKAISEDTDFIDSEQIIRFMDNYISLLRIVYKVDKRLIRSNGVKFLSKLRPSNYVWWLLKNYIITETEDILNKTFIDNTSSDTSVLIPNKIGILLYGYSKNTISVLCGFRDYIISQLIKNINEIDVQKKHIIAHFLLNSNKKNILEERVSSFFEIYVCECQPKNIFDHGKLQYHDGYEYIAELRKFNFTNITLIADSISGSLLTQYYEIKDKSLREVATKILHNKICRRKKRSTIEDISDQTSSNMIAKLCSYDGAYLFPRINYILLGTNGFDQKYIYHSAGHLSTIYSVMQKGRSEIILATQTSKYDISSLNGMEQRRNRSIPLTKNRQSKDGKFVKSYRDELIREQLFTESSEIYYNNPNFETESILESIPIYTPTEESIRFYAIDRMITEINTFHVDTEVGVSSNNNSLLYGPKHINRSDIDWLSRYEKMISIIAPYLKEEWYNTYMDKKKYI